MLDPVALDIVAAGIRCICLGGMQGSFCCYASRRREHPRYIQVNTSDAEVRQITVDTRDGIWEDAIFVERGVRTRQYGTWDWFWNDALLEQRNDTIQHVGQIMI